MNYVYFKETIADSIDCFIYNIYWHIFIISELFKGTIADSIDKNVICMEYGGFAGQIFGMG